MSSVTEVGSSSNSIDLVQNNTMGKDEFFKMLIAQLQNQDPLNPMDGTDFTAQLAQFSSLEQLANVNSNLEAVTAYQKLMSGVQSIDLIGKEITAEGNTVKASGSSVDIVYNLPEDVSKGTVSIFQSDGTLVETVEFGQQEEGINSVSWDCGSVEEGIYTFEVSATNAEGDSVEVDTLIKGQVTGVIFRDGPYVIVDDEEISYLSVKSVKDSDSVL
ncbi:MAG: hypothetical protein D4R45_02240 [Planctomycetaceae bacterium]|nr:MAG: hypothetical protein D4R45_02240 [Planctomycetaceae bacterium]